MRHGCKDPKLGLPADQRRALVRSLVTEVIRHGKITTTKVLRGGVQGLEGGEWLATEGKGWESVVRVMRGAKTKAVLACVPHLQNLNPSSLNPQLLDPTLRSAPRPSASTWTT